MVLRMEDLDPERSRGVYAESLMKDLHWLGLDWDEGPDVGGRHGPYVQSARAGLYEEFFYNLLDRGYVYPCHCSRAELRSVASAPHSGEQEFPYSGRCRKMTSERAASLNGRGRIPAYRLQVDAQEISFTDELYGMQSQNLQKTCGDFVIRRADGIYAYQLAVVADDSAMEINRIVRGADLLASTPRQIFLWRLLGAQPPAFLHVPLLLGMDGSRLSKRHGSLTLAALRDSGVKPETVIGRLAAWAGLLEKVEAVRAPDLIRLFSSEKLPQNPVVVSDNLQW